MTENKKFRDFHFGFFVKFPPELPAINYKLRYYYASVIKCQSK